MERSTSQSRNSTPSPNLATNSITTTTTTNNNDNLNKDSPKSFNSTSTSTSSSNVESESILSSNPITFEFPNQKPIPSSSSTNNLNTSTSKLGSGVVNTRKVKRSNAEPYNSKGPTRNNNITSSGSNSNTSGVANQLEAKVVILGSQGVGKTSIVHRYTSGNFSYSLASTIGASFLTKKLVVDGCKVRLQIWDTAGQERFRSMAPLYYRGALAAILVYDITNQDSFNDIKVWLDELRKNMTPDLLIHIVGSKADLSTSLRQVNLNDARKSIAEWILSSNSPPSTTINSPNSPNSTTNNDYSNYLSSNLLPPTSNSRDNSPSPRKERLRTMSTRTTGNSTATTSGGSNPSLKTSTSSSTSNPNILPSSTSGSSSPPLPSGSRSRKSSTKNSSSTILSASTTLTSSASTLIDLSLSASLNSTTGGNGKGNSNSSKRKGGLSSEEERRLEVELENERIEDLIRDCGVEVSEVSAKDDFGIEDLFLLITSKLVFRKAQIETNRILRSRDSFMLADTDSISVPNASGWCC